MVVFLTLMEWLRRFPVNSEAAIGVGPVSCPFGVRRVLAGAESSSEVLGLPELFAEVKVAQPVLGRDETGGRSSSPALRRSRGKSMP